MMNRFRWISQVFVVGVFLSLFLLTPNMSATGSITFILCFVIVELVLYILSRHIDILRSKK